MAKGSAVEVAPYWNVNRLSKVFFCSIPEVEVAPYWNVNQEVIK